MTRIIFLDFDGVLNSLQSNLAFGSFHRFDPVSVGLVDRLCAKSGAQIVVSSAWRPDRPGEIERLKRTMGEVGAPQLAQRVIDYTTRMPLRDRGEEIQQWVEAHKPERFVILDDSPDMLPGQPFVQTSMGRGFGLCEYVAALELLAPGHEDIALMRPYVGLTKFQRLT